MPSLTIGIAGITGKFARLLASCLLGEPEIKLKGLARDPSKIDASISSAPNVELYQGDAFEAEKLRAFVKGCDVVVCCYLGDDHVMVDGQKLLIDIAESERVSRYVASDWSLDWTKIKTGELFAKEPCQLVKAYLDLKGIKGVHILIGGFTDVIFAPFFRVWDAQSFTFRYWGTGDERWECSTYLDSAKYTAAVCLDLNASGVLRCKFNGHLPRIYDELTHLPVAGDVISTRGIEQTFEQVYGKKPGLECLGSLDELREKMIEERRKHGDDFYKYVF